MAEKAAHITSSLQAKPSIFEVIAQESLSELLYPSFKLIIQFLISKYPEKYSWLNEWYEEVFLGLNSFIQLHYLRTKDPVLGAAEELQEELTAYANYRVVVTIVDVNNFMTDNEVTRQQAELRQALVGVLEPSVPSEDTHQCSMCLTNRPTRLCLPCGHIVMCRNCTEQFTNHDNLHQVTIQNGDLMETHIRLPWCCPLCRAIIGSRPRVVLPSS